MTAIDRERVVVNEETGFHRKSFIYLTAGILALVVGFGSLAGGILGAWYTWTKPWHRKSPRPMMLSSLRRRC